MKAKNNQRPLFDDVLRVVTEEERAMLRQQPPLSRQRVARVVRAYVATIIERALRGERVVVSGLGVIRAVTRKSRRVLHAGRWYEVPASRVVVLRPSAAANRKRGAP